MIEGWMVIAGLYLVIIVPLIGYAYGRRRRWHGGAGWILLIGGQLFLATGGGDLFAWSGLLGFFVSGFGILLILTDLFTVIRSRRRRHG